MKRFLENLWKKRTAAAVALAAIGCFCGMTPILAAETVTISDYMAPNGEGSTWIYSRSEKGGGQGVATRITVIEDHYKFGLPSGVVLASQKLEERGAWKNGRFTKFKDEKRHEIHTYTGTGDRYRLYGTDVPVPGSPDRTKNRLRFSGGFGAGSTMQIGEKHRKRSQVYRADNLLGYTFFTMELLEKGTVKVPAGTFRDCIRLRFTIGVDAAGAEVGEEWWAKGVGLVKWKGISGGSAGVSEALVSVDLKEVIPYSPPGLEITGEHLYEVASSWGYLLRFPTIFIPGTLLEETVVLRNTGSEPLKGVAVKLINNPHFKMDAFEKRNLDGGESVEITVRMIVPAGSFDAISRLEIKCDDPTVDPITVPMSLFHIP
ncbi:MAG: hypothetical protein V4689_21450 [Verrucomicrobiota bacterium]